MIDFPIYLLKIHSIISYRLNVNNDGNFYIKGRCGSIDLSVLVIYYLYGN